MAESWAFRFQNDHAGIVPGGISIALDDGPFRGRLNDFTIRPGFRLCTVSGISTHRYVLEPKGEMAEGSLVLGNVLSGAGTVRTDGAPDQSWRDQRSFFALTPQVPVAYHVEPGREWSIVGLVIEPEALEELTQDDGMPDMVRRVMSGRRPFSMMRPLRDGARGRLASDLLDQRYPGKMARLYREAKCLEFLTCLLDTLSGDTLSAPLTAIEARRVRQARERLLDDLRSPPDLMSLSRAVKLSPKRLNEGFKALYGATAFAFLRDARLDEAKRLLDRDDDMPLKQVAWLVGYSHPTNLISAYQRRFGATPGKHRRPHR